MRTRLTDDRRQSLTAQIVVPTTIANRDNANMNENKSEFSQIRQSTHSKRTFAHTLTGANIHPNKQRSMHCHTKYPFKTMAGTYFCQVRRPDDDWLATFFSSTKTNRQFSVRAMNNIMSECITMKIARNEQKNGFRLSFCVHEIHFIFPRGAPSSIHSVLSNLKRFRANQANTNCEAVRGEKVQRQRRYHQTIKL